MAGCGKAWRGLYFYKKVPHGEGTFRYMNEPLVSCIMPTFNRRAFIPRALRCYLAQDWPNKELLILDDGTDKIIDLLPSELLSSYMSDPVKRTYGAKLNALCGTAKGEYVIHVDDDDVYPPDRITRQVTPLIENPALKVSGTSTLYYYTDDGRAFRYDGEKRIWLAAIAYPRSAWEERHFCTDESPGADHRWTSLIPNEFRFDVCDPALVIASIHTANHSPKRPSGAMWKTVPWHVVANYV
jgi:glycosyltransferase involved in cell wall biosynthesis